MRFSRRVFVGVSAAAFALATFGAQAAEKLSVVATTGMIADVAQVIGGDAVEVQALMGPGVDPHAYRQTRTDIVAMTRSDLVLWHGLYLEAQMENFLGDLADQKAVVAVGSSVPEEKLQAHEDYDGRFDPHVWMDPVLWSYVVGGVRDALTEAMPAEADGFAERADAYLAEAEKLGAYAEASLTSVPKEARVLVTAHDAFSYFGAAYGFEVAGIQGISTESEAGLNRIGELVDMLVERKVGAVFVESSVSDRNIRALIEGAAAQGHEVVIGGELFSDAMGPEGTYEGTWVGMIDHNITTIAGALGGDVPDGGMNGKLAAGS
ncbi:MAG: zinc ABC transporter substrate-binding protein [Pseudomonadota bacterium]